MNIYTIIKRAIILIATSVIGVTIGYAIGLAL
jgi:hypothetical protein